MREPARRKRSPAYDAPGISGEIPVFIIILKYRFQGIIRYCLLTRVYATLCLIKGVFYIHTCMKYVGMSLLLYARARSLSLKSTYLVILSGLFWLLIVLLALGVKGRFDGPVVHKVTDTSIPACTE